MSYSNWNFDQQQSTPKLLPPSVFEKTTSTTSSPTLTTNNDTFTNTHLNQTTQNQSDNSASTTNTQLKQLVNELDKFKYEINKLKHENDVLRNKNRNFIENAQQQIYSVTTTPTTQQQQQHTADHYQPQPHHSHHHCQISITTLEDIIHKQSIEIEQLKNDKQDSAKRLHDYEVNFRSLKQSEEVLQKKLKEKCELEEQLKLEVQQLNGQCEQLKSVSDQQASELKQLKLCTNQDYLKQLKNEILNYEVNFKTETNRNLILTKEIDLLQIRLKSIEEILSIQEMQLDSNLSGSNKNYSNTQKRSNLLTKWRMKVFELLVQLKSQQIDHRVDLNKSIINIKELERHFENLKQQKNIADSQIEDKKAQINYEKNENKKLTDIIKKLNYENSFLAETKQANTATQQNLNNFTNILLNNYKYIENSFEMINKKLLSFDTRIEYAKNRVDLIKTLHTHKDNKYKNEIKRLMDMSSIHGPNSNSTAIESAATNVDADEKREYKNELDKVLQERNLLASKLQDDMNQMNERLNKMKNEYELIINKLNKQLSEYEKDSRQKEGELNEMKLEYTNKTDHINTLNQKLDDLNRKFTDLQKTFELEYDKQLRAKERQYEEKMQEIEIKLNESRREQAKALVLMRQMERNVLREKDRMEKTNKEMEMFYKTNLDKLQMKIIALEKEKNIYMNTIRQNGIYLNKHETDVITAATVVASKQLFNENNNFHNNSNVTDVLSDKQLMSGVSVLDNTSMWLENNNNNANGSGGGGGGTRDEQNTENEANNNEILMQIRKIMGNLELSDIDDEAEEEDEEDGGDEEGSDRIRNDRYYDDNEHAVDDVEITN